MAKILVIDDDIRIRRLMNRILSAAGHSIIEANDGREGIAFAQSHQPSLVITDILMPGMEGMETLLEIRKIMPQTKVLVVSGSASAADVQVNYLSMAEKLGADAVLAKPFLPNELTEIVNKLIG
jgi:CheY-like chemotaxis protein